MDDDITIFNEEDQTALLGAVALATKLKKKREFTDLSNFSIRCGECYEAFKGQNDALEHAKLTGHTNFQEITK